MTAADRIRNVAVIALPQNEPPISEVPALRVFDRDLEIAGITKKEQWRRTIALYQELAGVGVPKEIVWWTPEEVEEWRNVRSRFITAAVRERKVLHEKST